MTVDIYRDTRPGRPAAALTGYNLDNGASVFVPVVLRGGDMVTVQPPRAPWWRFWDRPRAFAAKVVETHPRAASLELQNALDVFCDLVMTSELRVVGVNASASHVTLGLSASAYMQLKWMAGRAADMVREGDEQFTWRDRITFYIADGLEHAEPAGHA